MQTPTGPQDFPQVYHSAAVRTMEGEAAAKMYRLSKNGLTCPVRHDTIALFPLTQHSPKRLCAPQCRKDYGVCQTGGRLYDVL